MPLSVSRRDWLLVASRSHSAICADGETGKHSSLRGCRPKKDLQVRSPLCVPHARLVESVDTPVSGTGARKGMGVRISRRVPNAQVPEQVYESVSKTDAERRAGSSPALRTTYALSSAGRAADF